MTETKTVRYVDRKVPVLVHIAELRKLLVVCVTSLIIASSVAYLFFNQLFDIFQKPLGKTLYYTSPTAGFTFALKLCLTVGLIVSVPITVNRVFSFVKPAVGKHLHRSFAWYSFFSVLLAIAGVVFAYFISLPGALEFLTSFKAGKIEALITVDSYFTFFSAYLIGYAILFQTPIIMLAINKITPLGPKSTMRYQRHVIAGSFIVAAILTPTPDPWNQTLMAIPIILLYQAGIVLVWLANRKTKTQVKMEAPAVNMPQPQPIARPAALRQPVPQPAARVVRSFDNIRVPSLAMSAATHASSHAQSVEQQPIVQPVKYFDIIT